MAAQYAAMANNTAMNEQLRNAAARQATTQEQMATALDYERIMDIARRQTYGRPEPTPQPPPEPEKPRQAKDNEFTL